MMAAEYSGYCGMGTRIASSLSLMSALRQMRTAGLAPSVRKIVCKVGCVQEGGGVRGTDLGR